MQAREYAKAITGAVVGAATAAGTALIDGKITAAEWVGILVAAAATFGGVFQVPNRAPEPRGNRRAEVGASDPLYVLVLVLVALLVVGVFVWLFPNGR